MFVFVCNKHWYIYIIRLSRSVRITGKLNVHNNFPFPIHQILNFFKSPSIDTFQRNFTRISISFDILLADITINDYNYNIDSLQFLFFSPFSSETTYRDDRLWSTENKLRAIDILIRHRPNCKPILGQRCGQFSIRATTIRVLHAKMQMINILRTPSGYKRGGRGPLSARWLF